MYLRQRPALGTITLHNGRCEKDCWQRCDRRGKSRVEYVVMGRCEPILQGCPLKWRERLGISFIHHCWRFGDNTQTMYMKPIDVYIYVICFIFFSSFSWWVFTQVLRSAFDGVSQLYN